MVGRGEKERERRNREDDTEGQRSPYGGWLAVCAADGMLERGLRFACNSSKKGAEQSQTKNTLDHG